MTKQPNETHEDFMYRRLRNLIVVITFLGGILAIGGTWAVMQHRVNMFADTMAEIKRDGQVNAGRLSAVESNEKRWEERFKVFEAHINNSDIHKSSDQQRLVIIDAIQPLMLQLKQIEVQSSERERSVERTVARLEQAVIKIEARNPQP